MIRFLITAAVLAASVGSPRYISENFSVDLAGIPDARPGTWGHADYARQPIVFSPPAGYRVRILGVHGDFVAWPKEGAIVPGTSAEAGWGLKTTAPDGTAVANVGFDNTAVWVQCGITAAHDDCTRSYDRDFPEGFDLGPDNTLISQTFVAINTSGRMVHMEPTFTIKYSFVAQ